MCSQHSLVKVRVCGNQNQRVEDERIELMIVTFPVIIGTEAWCKVSKKSYSSLNVRRNLYDY